MNLCYSLVFLVAGLLASGENVAATSPGRALRVQTTRNEGPCEIWLDGSYTETDCRKNE
ncbi:small cysteine rich protein SCR58 [Phytophthora infestans T30-4]|uniref:Small cysteine rich protein SCR58 n=2 Tax=Phytophthora infestans TaxID=4787 RepID=D0P0J3_PHYIT|nr:small cysteine rich protein SCR58 [Phytophthora infestans T30-4]AAN31505.1 small cysteine rich protein SCR58 [Phytophthora infestans]EEY52956.1 small cysteine rich protein SCR58 [Phytophthora infestans T30-4]|eukprot:XP_002896166.1 small cysteine rich protein SCR58 [Phytophthora infestans T30-4]